MTFINTTKSNELYPVANALTSSSPFVDVFIDRDPTTSDTQYPIQKKWLNTTTNNLWMLKGFSSTGGVVTAIWIEFIPGANPVTDFLVDASTPPGTNPVVPAAGLLTVTGGQVPAGTTANVIRTDSLAANTYTIEIQRSQAIGVSTIGDNGVCHFNSANFTVDANGFVSLVGGGLAVNSIGVDAATGPGTNPVVPTAGGLITVTGAQIAAGSTANVIRTDSLAANTYTIEIQRSRTSAVSTIGFNGVSHYDSAFFAVDANGFVTINGAHVGETITGDTGGPLSPTAGNWNIIGGTVSAGSSPVKTAGAVSTLTINVQTSQAIAGTDATKIGLAAFDSGSFAVDANGFVTLVGGGSIAKVNVDASSAPGTNPVVPSGGAITVTGGQVAAGTTSNVIRTDSLSANTYTIQVQRSQAVAVSTVGDNGVCHFNSAQFSVDTNGFVSALTPANLVVNNQIFTSSGTYTPTAGMRYCIVQMLGGGGAGGGAAGVGAGQTSGGGGGGGGEYAQGVFSAATIGASKTVTIGAGGIGNSAAAGGNGGNTSLGALMSAFGGSGGQFIPTTVNFVVSGAAGGTGGAGGDFRTRGMIGCTGFSFNIGGGAFAVTTAGANSQFGAGGGSAFHNSTGGAASGYGAGGGGAINITGDGAAVAGGNGTAGIVIITEYISA